MYLCSHWFTRMVFLFHPFFELSSWKIKCILSQKWRHRDPPTFLFMIETGKKHLNKPLSMHISYTHTLMYVLFCMGFVCIRSLLFNSPKLICIFHTEKRHAPNYMWCVCNTPLCLSIYLKWIYSIIFCYTCMKWETFSSRYPY